jgi:hypothetical protein
MRIVILVLALSAAGCRCAPKVSHSIESTYSTTACPWDDKVIDKVNMSVTVRRSW